MSAVAASPTVDAGRPAWIEVDPGAIRRNVARIRGRLAPGAAYMAVVKANGYGHGAVVAARAAIDGGATWLGVVLVDEGIALRDAGIDVPILMLQEPAPGRADEAVAADLTPCVFTPRGIAEIAEAASRARRTVAVHLKIDTGMNRLGVPVRDLEGLLGVLAKEPAIEVEGAFSHLAFADDPANPFIDEQIARFADALAVLARHGIDPALRHIANSAATLSRPASHLDMVRVGIATYGLAPGPRCAGLVELEPALALKARVAMVKRVPAGEGVGYGLTHRLARDSTIATVPIGYADGWPRALSGRASVLVGGRRAPSVGRVSMDSFGVDLGDGDCAVGDEVVLIGAQGAERIAAEELAGILDTINYEIVASLSRRIPRVSVG